MKGGITAMEPTLFEFSDVRLPRSAQMLRIRNVIERELTACQREILIAVYIDGKSQVQVAAERGISRSTVCRTLARAKNRMQRFLRY